MEESWSGETDMWDNRFGLCAMSLGGGSLPHTTYTALGYSDGMILTTNDLNESDVSEVEPIGFSSFCFFVFFLAESDRKQNKVLI